MDNTLFVALIGLVTVQVGHLLNNILQSRHTTLREINEKKRETYFKWITAFNQAVYQHGKDEVSGKEFTAATAHVMLIAPDKVLEAMVAFNRALQGMTEDDLKDKEITSRKVMGFFTIVREMRKDCRSKITRITEEELRLILSRDVRGQ